MALLWTEPADVRSRWIGEKPLPEDTQIATLLEDAEDTVLAEFPDLPDRVEAEEIPEARVKKVVARIVMRHLRNPEGTRQRQSGAGPYQESITYGGDEPGSMYLTDEDRAELGGVGQGAAFTIDQTPAVVPTSPDAWLEVGRTWV